MPDWEAFFTLHQDLPREGPGDRASLDWAMSHASLPERARILDAGCGPGADIKGLLAAAPRGSVLAIDLHPPVVEQARELHAGDPRVTVRVGNMAEVEGPFDLIWCAGALYFLGLEAGLARLKEVLAPGGYIVFSHPCWFSDPPSAAARAFWEGEGPVATPEQVRAAATAAGLQVLADQPLGDAAWEAYYAPMEARIAALRATASPSLTAVLDDGEREIAGWRAVRRETGYILMVARRRDD